MNLKDLMKAMQSIEDDRKISKDIVIEALKEALAKAYRKHVDISDVQVRVDINEKSGAIKVYQQYTVVEEVEDDELEVSLEEARKFNPTIQLGELLDREVSIENLGRAAALLAKNVMKQKIREAEKQAVYDEYINLLDEMVFGLVESVEEKFVVVNLGKTMAIMPRAAQMPNETYHEGQNIRVLITECNNQSKGGAQVLVSRADANLVRRLFETEVPEIYDGVVEIKAIAREAGERTKMAVYSSNPDVDPIGACIGPRGSRVQVVIDELKGEKIDIFEWSDNIQELIKNALAPAQVLAVLPVEDKKGLMVVVEDNQLSLAIGKKGKNARLAVKLTGMKIDIKTRTDVEGLGIDWKAKMLEFAAEQKRLADAKAAEAYLAAQNEMIEEAEEVETVVEEVVVEPTVEVVEEDTVEEPVIEVVEEEIVKEEPAQETVEEVKCEGVKTFKKERERKEYVSRFEKLAGTSNRSQQDSTPNKKRKNAVKDEDRKLRMKDLNKNTDYELKPVYSEEELEEIKRNQEYEESNTWIEDDIDFDEYDEYYDQD